MTGPRCEIWRTANGVGQRRVAFSLPTKIIYGGETDARQEKMERGHGGKGIDRDRYID